MRRTFATCLLNKAKANKNIVLITMDLGWGMWDEFRKTLPEQFYNVGASEQSGMGIAVGLALNGKIPVAYSITTFLLYRGFETIRNYVNHESIPVKLIGSGRDKCYTHDGMSHWGEDVPEIMGCFKNISSYYPSSKEEIPNLLESILCDGKPTFISLLR